MSEPYDYKVEIDRAHDDDTPVTGCGCAQLAKLTVGGVKEIGACLLTPGDPSPVGRCPQCEALVYPDTPKARAVDRAERLFDCLKKMRKEVMTDGVVRARLHGRIPIAEIDRLIREIEE